MCPVFRGGLFPGSDLFFECDDLRLDHFVVLVSNNAQREYLRNERPPNGAMCGQCLKRRQVKLLFRQNARVLFGKHPHPCLNFDSVVADHQLQFAG